MVNDIDNNILKYQIFSYYVIEKVGYYITPLFNIDNDFVAFLNALSNRSYRDFNIELLSSDKILTFSTFVGMGDTPERLVIHTKRL